MNWSHDSSGATAADWLKWIDCPEAARFTTFGTYKVTYVKMRLDLNEVQAGANALTWLDINVASDT